MNNLATPYYVWKTEEEIQKHIREIADQIQEDFSGEKIHMLGILRGCFIFMADLVRNLKLHVHNHFMNLYYQESFLNDERIREIKETVVYPSCDYADKNILIIGSVLDTGVIINHLAGQIRLHNPRSLRLATLIDKKIMRKVDINADYVAFEEEKNDYIFGYGLEYEEHHRNLPFLAKLK